MFEGWDSVIGSLQASPEYLRKSTSLVAAALTAVSVQRTSR